MVKLQISIYTIGLLAAVSILGSALAQDDSGYRDYSQLTEAIQELGNSDNVSVTSLAVTHGGRDIWLITIGDSEGNKPGIAVVGSVQASHVLGAELCLRMAEDLVSDSSGMLDANVFHFIPVPSPDAWVACFDDVKWERTTNITKSDDDNDFRMNEDGYDDLNGDGLITMMRVEDIAGRYRTHPADDRVMISADREADEIGGWQMFTEGIDNDGDEDFNEDGPGGVDFNRNFPYDFDYFGTGAGAYIASEIETRALADFFYDNTSIAMVMSFSPEDNLIIPWKTSSSSPRDGRFHTAVHRSDAPYFDHIAGLYKESREEAELATKGAPRSPGGSGSFTEWAYYHYGRWSLTARGWWITEPEKKKEEAAEEAESEQQGETEPEEPTEEPEDVGDRGKDDLTALAWFDDQGIEGFVDWQKVDHPDFPGKLVEVGGFKPYLRLNPPAAMLGDLATQHFAFLQEALTLMPELQISDAQVDDLGSGIYRVSVKVTNTGYLPTVPAMGDVTRTHQRLQISTSLPDGASLLHGAPRTRLRTISGNGGTQEVTWRINSPDGGILNLKTWSPSVGEAFATLDLKTGEFTEGAH